MTVVEFHLAPVLSERQYRDRVVNAPARHRLRGEARSGPNDGGMVDHYVLFRDESGNERCVGHFGRCVVLAVLRILSAWGAKDTEVPTPGSSDRWSVGIGRSARGRNGNFMPIRDRNGSRRSNRGFSGRNGRLAWSRRFRDGRFRNREVSERKPSHGSTLPRRMVWFRTFRRSSLPSSRRWARVRKRAAESSATATSATATSAG